MTFQNQGRGLGVEVQVLHWACCRRGRDITVASAAGHRVEAEWIRIRVRNPARAKEILGAGIGALHDGIPKGAINLELCDT